MAIWPSREIPMGVVAAIDAPSFLTSDHQHRHLYGAQELERIFHGYGFCPSFLGEAQATSRARNGNRAELW